MGRSFQPFLLALEVPSSLLVTTSPLATGKPFKRVLPEKKEMPIVGLGESTWKMLKKMQPRMASVISVVI
jgi:hypothetical protein